jgi:hypothetical protein
MKSKKKVKMQDLINEVIEAVKKLFHPEVKAIKSQVDSLIEREVRWLSEPIVLGCFADQTVDSTVLGTR